MPKGPNGPLPKEILEMYPNAPLIKRQGEVDAWDNADFRAAVQASGKRQIVLAGIVTDVCKFSNSYPPSIPPESHPSINPRHLHPSSPSFHSFHPFSHPSRPLSPFSPSPQAQPSQPSLSAQRATPSGPTSKPAAPPRTSSPTRPISACRLPACSW